MTIEIKYYTDSAMSDLFKLFFIRFKNNSEYEYVNLIDSNIIQSKVIEIDYNDFTDEVKIMVDSESKEKIHTALYRAIGEIFQVR